MKLAKKLILPSLLVLSFALTGCSSNSKKKQGSNSDSVIEDASENSSMELNGSSDDSTAGPLQTVFFSLDSSNLSSAAKNTLETNAEYLKLTDAIDIQIEGHCDERGGNQYNLALGERRARAVRDYLVALGVDSGRISIISYGKEKPLSFGHNEEAWGQNRRANFVITAK